MTEFKTIRLSAAISLLGMFGIASCSKDVPCPDCVTLPSVSVEVRQSADFSQCRVLFTPDEGTHHFSYFLGDTDNLEAFETGSIVGIESLYTDSPQEVIFYDLQPKKEYFLYARAFDSENRPGATAVTRFFNGGELIVETNYLTSTSAGMKVQMGDSWSQCRYYIGTPDEGESFASGSIEGYTASDVDYFVANRFDLKADTDYAMFVIPVNRMGIEYEMMTFPFRTGKEGECADISVNLAINDVSMARVELVPNQMCSNIVAAISLRSKDGTMLEMTNSEMLQTNYNGDAQKMFGDLMSAGLAQISYNGNTLVLEASMRSLLECDRELEVLAMMQNQDGSFAGIKMMEFKTPSFDPSAGEASATVEIVDVVNGGGDYGTYHQVKAIVQPNENTLGYFVKFMSVDEYNQIVQGEDGENELRKMLMNDWNYTSYVYGPNPYAYINEMIYSWYTENYIVVCPFNANGIEGWGPIVTEYFEIK